jgi:hypothetical protein
MNSHFQAVGRGDPPGRPPGAEHNGADEPAARPHLNRRAFFRALWFVALGGIAVVLLRRSCAGTACGGCPKYTGCGLPWKEARR